MKQLVKKDLSFDVFLYKLEQECEYHKNGGTNYRQRTAELSLEVAIKVKEVNPFLDPLSSKKLVVSYFPSLDNHRKNDVAKMLRVLAKNLYIESNTSNEVLQYVNHKMNKTMILRKL